MPTTSTARRDDGNTVRFPAASGRRLPPTDTVFRATVQSRPAGPAPARSDRQATAGPLAADHPRNGPHPTD